MEGLVLLIIAERNGRGVRTYSTTATLELEQRIEIQMTEKSGFEFGLCERSDIIIIQNFRQECHLSKKSCVETM